METYQSEQEQVEALKKWWRENTVAVVGGVVLGLGVAFAVWAWRDYHNNQAIQASAEYEQLMGDVRRGAAQEALERSERIMREYGGTPYAVFAALVSARIALDNGDNTAARQQLEWALAHASEPAVEQLARLRLARVMLDQDDAEAALKLIHNADAGGYRADYDAVLGDIYLALKQMEQSRSAYQKARQAMPANSEQAALIQMKLDDLGAVDSQAPVQP
ncbi:MAG: tetratricopeptide repeat protein [Gammaproteobacteria bacterium]|nr:tetratricopeptide repeat protein [Gammaproteobacteria bacterium]